MRDLNTIWKAFAPDTRNRWADLSRLYQSTDRFGRPYTLPGYQTYVRAYLSCYNYGTLPHDYPDLLRPSGLPRYLYIGAYAHDLYAYWDYIDPQAEDDDIMVVRAQYLASITSRPDLNHSVVLLSTVHSSGGWSINIPDHEFVHLWIYTLRPRCPIPSQYYEISVALDP